MNSVHFKLTVIRNMMTGERKFRVLRGKSSYTQSICECRMMCTSRGCSRRLSQLAHDSEDKGHGPACYFPATWSDRGLGLSWTVGRCHMSDSGDTCPCNACKCRRNIWDTRNTSLLLGLRLPSAQKNLKHRSLSFTP
jgi:hypothetical protein